MTEGEFRRRIRQNSTFAIDVNDWEISSKDVLEWLKEARREFPKSHPFNDLDTQIGYEEEEINKWSKKWLGTEEKEEVKKQQ